MVLDVYFLTFIITLCCQLVSVDSRPWPKKTNTLPQTKSDRLSQPHIICQEILFGIMQDQNKNGKHGMIVKYC